MLVLTRKAKQQIQIGPQHHDHDSAGQGPGRASGHRGPREHARVLRTEVAPKMASDSHDPTVMAALEKLDREKEISSAAADEQMSGRSLRSANGSLRCRAPRVDVAPLSSS